MKLKCTNVLVTIAMICSVLAMIMNWIIYFGPQDKYIQSFGVDVNNERIFDIRCIICPILTVGLYILACTITRKSQKKRTGLTISIVVLVSHIILNVLNVVSVVAVNRKYAFFYGASVLAKASILNNMRNFMEKPFHILAMIFLAITIGTLCGRDNNMQQTPYYGDPMYQMPNNGHPDKLLLLFLCLCHLHFA